MSKVDVSRQEYPYLVMSTFWNISFLSLILALLPVLSQAEENVYVQSSNTRLLTEPSLSSGTIVKLDRGSKLLVIKRQDSWLRVASGNKTGWVYAFSITDQAPTKNKHLQSLEQREDTKKPRRKPSSVPTTAVIRGLDAPENLKETGKSSTTEDKKAGTEE